MRSHAADLPGPIRDHIACGVIEVRSQPLRLPAGTVTICSGRLRVWEALLLSLVLFVTYVMGLPVVAGRDQPQVSPAVVLSPLGGHLYCRSVWRGVGCDEVRASPLPWWTEQEAVPCNRRPQQGPGSGNAVRRQPGARRG